MQCRGASCSPQDRLTPSPSISPAFLPFSPSRSLCVLVFPPPPLGSLGSGCPSAVPPAPSGAEGSAPPPFGRQHHFCLLERVSGNGVSPTAGPCTPDLLCSAVLLRPGLSVCPPWLCPPCQGRAVWGGGWETHPMGNMEGGGPTTGSHILLTPAVPRPAGCTAAISAPTPACVCPTSSTGGW